MLCPRFHGSVPCYVHVFVILFRAVHEMSIIQILNVTNICNKYINKFICTQRYLFLPLNRVCLYYSLNNYLINKMVLSENIIARLYC